MDPRIVFADQPDTFGPGGGTTRRSAWVEFLPYEEPPARVCLDGRRWELEEAKMEDLLLLVDEAYEISRAGGDPGCC